MVFKQAGPLVHEFAGFGCVSGGAVAQAVAGMWDEVAETYPGLADRALWDLVLIGSAIRRMSTLTTAERLIAEGHPLKAIEFATEYNRLVLLSHKFMSH